MLLVASALLALTNPTGGGSSSLVPWHAGDRLHVTVTARGGRSADGHERRWDMSLEMDWTFSAADGGLKISMQRRGDWVGQPPPGMEPSGEPHYLGITQWVALGPDGQVTAAEATPKDLGEAGRKSMGLGGPPPRPPTDEEVQFHRRHLLAAWGQIFENLRLLERADEERFDATWTAPARFGLAGKRPVRMTYHATGAPQRCPKAAQAGGCHRLQVKGVADVEDLLKGYAEAHPQSNRLTEVAREMTRYLVTRRGERAPLELAMAAHNLEHYVGTESGLQGRIETDFVLQLNLAPTPATPPGPAR